MEGQEQNHVGGLGLPKLCHGCQSRSKKCTKMNKMNILYMIIKRAVTLNIMLAQNSKRMRPKQTKKSPDVNLVVFIFI